MPTFTSILLATFAITLCVWVAVCFLFFKTKTLQKITIFLVSLSAGSLMGGAFLHLMPEAAEVLVAETVFGIFLLSFAIFFVMEKALHWRHCHKAHCDIHTFGHMNLIGDSIHNFIDGLVIAGAFMVDAQLGIAAALAVAIHEVPQEIGDYGVLIHAGFQKKTALMLNYAVALTVVLGGIVGFFFFLHAQTILPYLLPFAAGGFVYIAASDLIPEIRKETNIRTSAGTLFVFSLGVLLMYLMKSVSH